MSTVIHLSDAPHVVDRAIDSVETGVVFNYLAGRYIVKKVDILPATEPFGPMRAELEVDELEPIRKETKR